jgi:hypothetical protein
MRLVTAPPVRVPVPRAVVPSRNVTVPVAFKGETTALSVMFWPMRDGFTEVFRVIVVVARPTVWARVEDVLGASLVSPPYAAVSEWAAAESEVVVNVATPLVRVPVPRAVAPSLNVTVPVAVDGDTVAVRVTLWPKVVVLADEVRTVLVAVLLTVWASVADVLVASFVSPPYVAVNEWAAAESEVVVNVATPLVRVPVPRAVAPSLNVTVPVAVDGDTVAVRVTLWPNVEVLADEVRMVLVPVLWTVWARVEDVLAASFVSPPYAAVSEWAAAESEVVVNVAMPLVRVPVPRAVVPSLNVTVPVAVDGDTVAVRVTLWPKVEVLADEVRTVVVAIRLTVWVSERDVLVAFVASPP